LAIGERKWGGDFRRRMMMFEREHGREYIDVRGREMGIEETRRGREKNI
jgi:hypothetical protein